MESSVEIRYAGVVIGRAQEVRSADGDTASFFLVTRESMPVGTVLHLRTGDRDTPARVVHTVESSDSNASGMGVRLIGEAEEVAREWIPPPATAAEKPHPSGEPVQTAMPVIEVKMPSQPVSEASSAIVSPSLVGAPETPPVVQPSDQARGASVVQASAEPAPAASPTDSPAGSTAGDTRLGAPAVEVDKLEAAARPSAAAGASGEIAAIPEAVPVAVGSSMTGALENAAEGAPAPVEPSPSEASEAERASADTQETSGSPPVVDGQTNVEDLPPARPIAGPSGRRKTKRRR
jgi:hypothetical protein